MSLKKAILFIDGPPYYFFAREAALYSCFDYLSDNSIIILDDAMRNNYEKVFINNWHFIYDKNLQIDIYTDNYEKGLCVILKKNSYLKTKKLSSNWDYINSTSNLDLVNQLSMICPFSTQEKQMLLESNSINDRYILLTSILQNATLSNEEKTSLKH